MTLVVLIAAGGYGYMRFHDGPVEFFPWFTISIGGPFRSGDTSESTQNWDFIKDREEIEIQTINPATSRTIWPAVVDGQLYITSGYMTSFWGKLWKQWPSYLEADNRILLRIDGNIYQRRLNRITEGPMLDRVMSEIRRKYFGGTGELIPGAGNGILSGRVWLFEVVDN